MGHHQHHDHDHHGHDHDHGHPLGHHHHGEVDAEGPIRWVLAFNLFYFLVEVGVGWTTGSLALLSDAAHMLGDVSALSLAWAAARLARRPAADAMTFGLRRTEVLGAFVNGLLLLLASVWIVSEAFERLLGGAPPIPGLPVLATAVVGLIVNLGSAWVLHRGGSGDLNSRGALLHMLADALGSVGAIASALLVMQGVAVADTVISLGLALLVGGGAVPLLRDAGRILLQLPPHGFDVGRVRALLKVDGVEAVHDLHAWTLDGRNAIVSAHLVVCDPAQAEAVRRAAAEAVDAGVHAHVHLTLQVEHTAVGCAEVDCGAPAPG